jgi:hypothetical protein
MCVHFMKIDSLSSLKQGQAKLWMVLIGVNHYQTAEIPSLNFAVADCQGLAAALQFATSLFPRRELLTHYGTPEQPLQLADIEPSLERLFDPIVGMKPQDIVLFFFSGHGVLAPSTQQLYLCLSDTRLIHLHQTGLPIQSLLQRLKASGVGQQVIILDACHSDQVHFTSTLETTLQAYGNQNQDFQALLSCSRGDQIAWELADLQHSVFTYYLIEGIRGAAADAVGQINVDDLYRYVRDRTHQLVQERLKRHQIPSHIKVGQRDIIIGYQHPDARSTFAVSMPPEMSQLQQSDRGLKSWLLKTSPSKFSKFLIQPSMRIAAGIAVLSSTAIAGTKLYQQHQLQQTEQAELDHIRQLQAIRQYPDCISSAERFPPTSHFRPAAQGLSEQCRSAQYQAWLTQGQAFANQDKFSEAIAHLRQIPPPAAIYPVAQKIINQTAQQILNAASQHYLKGELDRAISLVQMTPKSSTLYQESQHKVKQWKQSWQKDKNHFANAAKAKAKSTYVQVIKESEQIKHPYWKQKVLPLVIETKVALNRLEKERKQAIAAIAPPSYLAQVPVYAPSGDRPVHQPIEIAVNSAPARSLPPAPRSGNSTISSAEVERF